MDKRGIISVAELVDLMTVSARPIAEKLFPEGRSSNTRLQVGSLAGEAGSSLSVYFGGRKPGNWKDMATEERGDILDLVAHVLFDGNKGPAIEWAKRFLGVVDADPGALRTRRKEAEAARLRREKQGRRDRARKREAAWRRWGIEGQPQIRGTAVDLYLQSRGILLERLPSHGAIRYHPELLDSNTGELLEGMVAAVTNMRGEFIACHRTFLERDGAVYRKARIPNPKRVLGLTLGGFISVNKGASGVAMGDAPQGETCILCEGLEDAYTLAMALPKVRIVATVSLAGMAAAELPKAVTRRILMRDPDTNAHARQQFEKAVAEHQRQGAEVRVVSVPGGRDANAFLQSFNRKASA